MERSAWDRRRWNKLRASQRLDSKARELGQESNRKEITDVQIGQLLSHSPLDTHGAWPHVAVREVLEELESGDLDDGFVVETFNTRGVISKGWAEGGKQEWELAGEYRRWQEQLEGSWIRTARLLKRIADGFEADARREDERVELI